MDELGDLVELIGFLSDSGSETLIIPVLWTPSSSAREMIVGNSLFHRSSDGKKHRAPLLYDKIRYDSVVNCTAALRRLIYSSQCCY